jgi:peptidoglycan/xylan/chitin deacetylase (PgdA/CDA1 family)
VACWGVGALALAERRNRRCLTILSYHRVLPEDLKRDYYNPDVVVTPESLRHHCRVLAERYDILPLSEAVQAWRKRSRPSRPLAAVTFDDGYRDNYEYAAPILAEVGITATFFLIGGLVGSDRTPWYDNLARAFIHWHEKHPGRKIQLEHPVQELQCLSTHRGTSRTMAVRLVAAAKRLPPVQRKEVIAQLEADAGHLPVLPSYDLIMDWRQLKELAAAGHEIGSHTCTHEILPQLDDAPLKDEILGSRTLLEEHLGRRVRSLSYPNGDVDNRVAKAVSDAGYECAVTVTCGSNADIQDVWHLKRRFMHEGRLTAAPSVASSLLVRAELCGLSDRVFGRGLRSARGS